MKKKRVLFNLLIVFLVGCNNSSFSNDSTCNHNIVIDTRVEPTCTKSGLSEGSHCTKCNEVFVSQEVIEPLGHNIVIDVKVESDCAHTGLSEGSHCSRCNEIFVKQDILDKKEHTPVIDKEVEGTCITKGLSKGSHCKVCNEILTKQEETTYGNHAKGALVSIPLDYKDYQYSQVGEFRCKYCENNFYANISPKDINMPIINIDGSLDGITKENKKKVKISYDDGNLQFSYDSTIKLQGGSSVDYPKKNYNIQFFKDDTFNKKQKVEIKSSWGKQNKYTLKANYVDFSQARNVVSAKIYGDIVHSKNIDDEYDKLVNGGAIDGFPVLVYVNNECYGLYTMNTPKDEWLFEMDGDETTKQALIMANDWSKACRLKEKMNSTIDNGWELEYSSTEDTSNAWISKSFNNMIDFITNNDGQAFKNGIGEYVDVYRVIDAMLYTWFISAYDNVSKNILWSTYDGIKWQPNVYDLDGTWGLRWDGEVAYGTGYSNESDGNLLWEKIYANYKEEIVDEWFELRKGPLSYNNIKSRFMEFINGIDSVLYEYDSNKWEDVPSHDTNNLHQILSWASKKGANQDKYFKNLV